MSLRVIQVGLGPWGLNWSTSVIAKAVNIEVVAFVARSDDTLENARRELGCHPSLLYKGLELALDSVDSDAVLVLTDTPSHDALIRIALAAGKHVLVEKPFVENSVTAKELANLARSAERILMVNQNFRYYPAAQAAIELVNSQTLGRLNSINIDFCRNMDVDNYKIDESIYQTPHALIVDMCIHHFDLIRKIADAELQEVFCKGWNPPWSRYKYPAAAFAVMTMTNNITVSYRASRLSQRPETPFGGHWRMECEHGEIFWTCRGDRDITTDADQVVIQQLGQPPEIITLQPNKYFGRAGVLAAFEQAVRTGTEPTMFSSASDNVGTIQFTEAVARATDTGKVVLLGDAEILGA